MRTGKFGPYIIKSFPVQKKDRLWSIEVRIFRERDGIVTMETHRPDSGCLSEEHADIYGISYAKQMIDQVRVH